MAFRAQADDESWMHWAQEMVDYRMEQHGARTGPEFEYYVTQHGKRSDYSDRTPEQLSKDVNVLHQFTRQLVQEKNEIQDRLRTLRKAKDEMQQSLSKAERKVDMANLKIWILTIVLAAEGTIIGWMVHEFLAGLK
jgi:chromosome segregation ATPase